MKKQPLWLRIGLVWGAILGLCSISVLTVAQGALAADVRGAAEDDVFRLPADQVINDDLYVAAQEVYIDGSVEGDLVAAGAYVEVNGTVSGDAILAGGSVVLNGVVEDDARLAGGGVTVSGRIGDDFFAAGGGGSWRGAAQLSMQWGGPTTPQGVQLTNSAVVGGDAYIVGGQGLIDGAIAGDLFSGMGALLFGGQVDGDAQLYAETLEVRDAAKIAGTLRYNSGDERDPPAGVATEIQEAPDDAGRADATTGPNLLWEILRWIWRTLLLALGFAGLVWLLWRLAPDFWTRNGSAISGRPAEAALYGLLGAALILPLVLALILLAAIFWGWAGALATSTFLFGALGLLWILSPILTGYWLGQQLTARGVVADRLLATVAGALLIALVARVLAVIPCVGALAAGAIYLLSFALALGGVILARRQLGAALAPAAPDALAGDSTNVRVYGNL